MSATSSFRVINHDDQFITELLLQQQELPAVEAFSQFHETHSNAPSQSRFYQDLLPATAPAEGQQYRFNVDLDACSGCKACVVACQTLNGLDREETWRSVGALAPQADQESVVHVTSACHHCADPGCLKGCPVKAYEKDPATGIVRHLDDQCIGCQYCTMTCPYDVPKYSSKMGIVRKCDMCHQRLAVGEAPGCVQACPNKAISIDVVDVQSLRQGTSSEGRLVPSAPRSAQTVPSTQFVSTRALSKTHRPQNDQLDLPSESHWPLAIMLVLSQLSVGVVVVIAALAVGGWIGTEQAYWPLVAAACLGIIGIHIAMLHLGRPLYAFRAVLGVCSSWMSREILTFGLYMGLISSATLVATLPRTSQFPMREEILAVVPTSEAMVDGLLVVSAVVGLLGVYCSAMIYVVTGRVIWRATQTMTRFLATAMILGTIASGTLLIHQGVSLLAIGLCGLGVLTVLVKLRWERIQQRYDNPQDHGEDDPSFWDARSGRLVNTYLAHWVTGRRLTAVVGIALLGIGLGLLWTSASAATVTSLCIAGAASITVSEITERLLYFMGVVHAKMPGGLR